MRNYEEDELLKIASEPRGDPHTPQTHSGAIFLWPGGEDGLGIPCKGPEQTRDVLPHGSVSHLAS